MEAHQERVVTEKAELDEKIEKLDAFLKGTIYLSLSEEEQFLLRKQLALMQEYAATLGQRIAAF